MARNVKLVTLLFGLLSLALAAQANDANNGTDKTGTRSGDKGQQQHQNQPSNLLPTSPGYVIGSEDVLKISVWKETELTNTVTVRPDGKISVALLGDVQATGLTPMQLANHISDKLKQYISDPRVTVVVNTINSRKVFILGEVLHTGSYNLMPQMTVLQALSSAGGFSQWADLKGIYVLRTENGKQTKLKFNYRQVIKGHNVNQNVALKPGDTIVVP